MNIKVKEFLVDKRGRPKGVILKISEYRKLVKFLQDIQDTIDLKEAIKTNKGFITEEELLKRLKTKGINV